MGGLEGDFYKGPLRASEPPPLEQGIRLHRSIDAFTDSHALVTGLRRQFPEEVRRYSGVLIDLGFDHFLSLHWSNYHSQSLSEFNAAVYAVLHQQQKQLSPAAALLAGRILEYDLLGAYHDWRAVPASARRIGERFKRGNPFLDVEPQLTSLMPQLETAFLEFYPNLVEFVAQCKNNHNPAESNPIDAY